MVTGRLGYNPDNGRYGLLVSDLWEKFFHCADRLEVLIDDNWISTRFEMTPSGQWYLTDTDLKGDNIEFVKARIEGELRKSVFAPE